MRRETALILFIILMLFPTKAAFSAWSNDPAVNTPICTAPEDQWLVQITSDGSGGAIIAWEDRIPNEENIYAQRLDSLGNAQWSTNGVPVCSADDSQTAPQLVSDGSGGAFIAWTDSRNMSTASDIYAQRVDSMGNAMWTADGVGVCTANNLQLNPQLISDGVGGVIITWEDDRSNLDPISTSRNIYAQRLDSLGNALWAFQGAYVCTAGYEQREVQLIPDGSDGAIITWSDARNREGLSGDTHLGDIYAQRLDSSSNALWTTNGVPVCIAPGDQRFPQIVSDGSGGALIAWSSNTDIYAQHLDSSGNALWQTNGVLVVKDASPRPHITSDGSGGVIIAWEEWNELRSERDIYAQRIDPNGNALWTEGGIPVCSATGSQSSPQLTSDGSGGAIIIWSQGGSGTDSDIYAQRLDSSGNVLWAVDGVPISTAANFQSHPQLISDGSSGAIIVWDDDRNQPANSDIFAQRVKLDGSLAGAPSPPLPTEQASLVIPWYNDSGGSNLLASFITVFNPTPYNITVTVTYKITGAIDASPEANTFILGPGQAKSSRPLQASGVGEGIEHGPPFSMPNATSQGPFGSATFTAQVPAGSKIYGDVLRVGAIDLDGDGTLESFSGIAPAHSR